MNNEASRKAFEAWCAASNQKYHPTDDGLSNRQDWQTWQASRKALEAEQAQAVEPVCRNCIGTGWEPHMYRGRIPCSHCHPTPAMHLSEILAEKGITLRTEFEPKLRDPIDDVKKMVGERAELIAKLRSIESRHLKIEGKVPLEMLDFYIAATLGLHDAAALLEADAEQAVPMQMPEIIAVAEAQHINAYVGTFLCGIRAAEAHHKITPQGDKT